MTTEDHPDTDRRADGHTFTPAAQRVLAKIDFRVDWHKGHDMQRRVSSCRTMGWLVSLLTLGLAGCASPLTQPLTGVVIDASTGQGMGGVVVIAAWTGNYGIVEKAWYCAHVESTLTDAHGRFVLPGAPTGPDADTQYKYRYIEGYKTAYQPVAGGVTHGTTIEYQMKPDPAPADQRFAKVDEQFWRLRNEDCGFRDGSGKNLYKLHIRQAAEMRDLAHTAEQEKKLRFVEAQSKSDLVNPKKPTRMVSDPYLGHTSVNIDPNDAFRAEDLLLK